MNGLFARLYLDEDVSVVLAELLKARGFHAVTTRELGHLRARDAEQLGYAASWGMALLTHNRADFEALHRDYLATSKEHWGILVATRRRPPLLLQRLLPLLDRLSAEEMRGQLLFV